MFNLIQSQYARGSAGEPLPTVFEALEEAGLKLIRGQLVLIAAGPGVGKSAFTLTLAMKSKVPTVYFSADSDSATQASRALSIATGMPTAMSSEIVLEGLLDTYNEHLRQPIHFDYDASPSIDHIENVLEAYKQIYDHYPELIVVDNITNVRKETDEDAPFEGLEALMDYLHTVARNTGACVVGLHHVTGSFNDADKPVPLSGIKGQIGRVPEVILTLHKSKLMGFDGDYDQLNVSIVKNRSGRAEPSGHNYVSLSFVGERMQIK